MFKYKSKYNQKASSVYGVPTLSIIRELIKNTGIDSNSNILIPNCNDGLYVIPFTRMGYNITCYNDLSRFFIIIEKLIDKHELNLNKLKVDNQDYKYFQEFQYKIILKYLS